MTAPRYYLVTDACADEVERKIGVRGRDTPLGTLIEAPAPFPWAELELVRRALDPSRCTCGRYAILHSPNCPMWMVMT